MSPALVRLKISVLLLVALTAVSPLAAQDLEPVPLDGVTRFFVDANTLPLSLAITVWTHYGTSEWQPSIASDISPWTFSVGAAFGNGFDARAMAFFGGASGEVLVGVALGIRDVLRGEPLGFRVDNGLGLLAGAFVVFGANDAYWATRAVDARGRFLLPALGLEWWTGWPNDAGASVEIGCRYWYVPRGALSFPDQPAMIAEAWHFLYPLIAFMRLETFVRVVL